MAATRPISRLLIANRGEIACRIARTCRALGITSIGIYSAADRAARHTREVDLALHVGGAAAASSYLDGRAICEAAQRAGADAVHPGYGFLSESASFAELVLEAGLTWVGPPPEAMRAMADKMAARRLARNYGIPTLPGYDGDQGQETEVLLKAAQQVGFPLMVKAAAGGGGRGMRLVRDAGDLTEALFAAAREAYSAFGDDRLLLERYLEHARHVEVQVLADNQGQVMHVFERDCSVQRRQQKVIEEAPAPSVAAPVRARLGEAAVRLAQLVGYRGAGTVEFLLDPQDEFYFLEMNTRLQVEHPVTEAISGLDLVELQIRIAEGRCLPVELQALRPQGHAIEVRIYAEDPLRDFAPVAGRIERVDLPDGPGLRIDSGYDAGDEVTTNYDALLAKITVHGADRAQAVRRLQDALRRAWIAGITTNLPMLRQISHDASWACGNEVDTAFLQTRGLPWPAPVDLTDGLLAAALVDWEICARALGQVYPALRPGWRLCGRSALVARWRSIGAAEPLPLQVTRTIEHADGELEVALADGAGREATHRLRLLAWRGDTLDLVRDGMRTSWRVALRRARGDRDPAAPLEDHDAIYVHTGLGEALLVVAPRLSVGNDVREDAGSCHASMPGTVTQIHVSGGEAITAGTPLVTLEAMKMEQTLVAPRDGIVEQVLVDPGDAVEEGAVLVTLGAEALDEG